jgi:putative hemolysin
MVELMLFRTVSVALLILANGFFVAAEFALVSVRETRIERLIALGPGPYAACRKIWKTSCPRFSWV